ncbi:MAG: hypothetical protein M1165_00870 [Candidatus Pacearchaeota archaeon]|nr:hypothetical protein [Candidatus Pacearchaeota archaeon]
MNLLNYLGIGKKKTKETRAKFHDITGTIEPVNTDGLSYDAKKFTKYVRTVLAGTKYGVNCVIDNGEAYGCCSALIELYKLRHGPTRFLGRPSCAGTIVLGTMNKDARVIYIRNEDSELKGLARRIREYSTQANVPKPF